MKISDLSARSGVSVPTIKFYLRERLLPPGDAVARNQAVYADHHLRRLRFIRALTTIGQLDLATVRRLIAVMEDDTAGLGELYGVLDEALFPSAEAVGDFAGARDLDDLDRLLDDLGWNVHPDSSARRTLGCVITALRQLGCQADVDFFAPFAAAAASVASRERSLLPPEAADVDRGAAVIWTVMFGIAFRALRRLAYEHQMAAATVAPAGVRPDGRGA